MFNNNTFLNQYLPADEDFTAVLKSAVQSWNKGAFSWNNWASDYLLKQKSVSLSGINLSDWDFLVKTTQACFSNELSFEDVQISEDEDIYTTHLQMTAKLTDRTSGEEKDYHICRAYNKNLLSANYTLEIVPPEMQYDVTVCHCAEHRMKKFVPAFA